MSVEIASYRSLFSASEGLGQRLMIVNDEIFAGMGTLGEGNRQRRIFELKEEIETLKYNTTNSKQLPEKSRELKIEKEIERIKIESAQNREAYEVLNTIGEREFSLSLPFILLLSLLASFSLAAGLQTQLRQDVQMLPMNAMLGSILTLTAKSIGYFSVFSSAVVCWLFSKCEIQNAFKLASTGTSSSSSESPTRVGVIVSSVLVVLAYLHIPIYGDQVSWIAQNVINMCIAITFSRVIQIKELKWVIVALLGVTFYDYFGVIGSQQLTDGGKSVMEAVARARVNLQETPSIASSSLSVKEFHETLHLNQWRPGLLQIVIQGKPSDLFGLGDIAFPSLLAGWSLRKDGESSTKGNSVYFRYSMISYVVGCMLLEFLQTGSGQPALIYLVPSMLIGLSLAKIHDKSIESNVD